MAVWTMSFSSVDCRNAFTSAIVFLLTYRLKMLWVNAKPVLTQVVNVQALWNRSFVKFVGYAMSWNKNAFAIHGTITAGF